MALRDARVLVVGGTSGIGLASARALIEVGSDVVVASRSAERLNDARRLLPGVDARALDMTCRASVNRFFDALGGLDHLIVTAANAATGTLAALDPDRGRAFLDGKLWGQYLLAREAAPRLRPGGSIVLFSGAAARRASPGFALGSAINAAVEALSTSLAAELAPVRVNALSPGVIDTPVWSRELGPEVRARVFDDLVPRLPLGRAGRPEEVAMAVLFLLEATYVTGSVLSVDGGFSLV
jgi:NAD(P)-dependent dehydrogenase (short-subunit alcohol dehydrogenase family)